MSRPEKTRPKRKTTRPRQRFSPSPRKHGQAQRINRILSSAGLTSRRKADEWIKSGRVTVNGILVTDLGAQAIWGKDHIQVDGREIPYPSERVYLMLNKPFGYMCSLSDPQGRPLVTDLLSSVPVRVYPVGRLDFDSMGLLLLTNDGEWANRLTHPRYRVPRTYKVTVSGQITDEAIGLLNKGVRLKDGPAGRPKITLITRNKRQSVFRMTITQGKSRQIRRMMEIVGFSVVHLIRIGFGGLALGDLKVGEYRYLETDEVESLKKLAGMS